MGGLEDSVLSLLRPSEELRTVLETQLLSPVNASLPASGTIASRSEHYNAEDTTETRILAVVSHQNDWSVSEEGSVFVCKFKPIAHGMPNELDILRVLPITEDFSIAMAQMRRGTIDLSTTASMATLDQPSGFSLTINPGQSTRARAESLILFTYDVQNLRVVVSECKRLKKPSDAPVSATPFRWLLPYTSRSRPRQILNAMPQDLRFLNRPLHTRLSPASAGLPGDDFTDLGIIREEWLRSRIRKIIRRGRRRISLRIGTFNVNGKLPSQDLASWIRGPTGALLVIPPLKEVSPLSQGDVARDPFGSASATSLRSPSVSSSFSLEMQEANEVEAVDSDPYPDMLVLGFQELDLSTEALLYSTSTVREDAWCVAIFAALGEKAVLYEKLASKQLVGMLIVILVKKVLLPCFADVQTSAAGAGIMGVLGNKGGAAVRLTFTPPLPSRGNRNNTTFTFVNSHLAAFDEQYDKRNSDFHDLSRRLNFDSETPDSTGLAPLPISVYESDVLFWMGDLNYRLDLPDSDVRSILASEQWDDRIKTLLQYDQLKKAMHAGKAFDGFTECLVTYPPTYRFGEGPTDGLAYDQKRKPAWTDRVLYMTAPSVWVQPYSYTSHPQITMSDHRPVSADFAVDVDFYEMRAYNATAHQLYKVVDYLEEYSERSSIILDNTSVDLGKISYKRPTSQTIRIRNNGKVACAFRFVPIDENSDIHPDWLRIEPMTGLLLPDETISISLTAYVNHASASKLNLGPKSLDPTLILHTLMGKDHFISVTGEFQYTCFSNALSRLVRLRGPARSASTPDYLLPDGRPINAPREVMRLVNWLMSDHGSTEDLFDSPGDEQIVYTIRECLDTGEEFPFSPKDNEPSIPLAFATTLLQLLDSLTEPVVPAPLHPRCIQLTSRDEAFELLGAFPPHSVNVWISVTAFLHFICQASKNPLDRVQRIAMIFAPVLLRDDPESQPPVSPLGRRNFLLYFIS